MKKTGFLTSALALTLVASLSLAAGNERDRREGGPAGRPRMLEPRAKGVPQYGTVHHITPVGGKMMESPVLHDRRTHTEIIRDPRIVTFNHVGWKPAGHWNHWYRDWGVFWRLTDWSRVQTVTCEAVNVQTEALYPVSETRTSSWVWTADLVNNVAARALDECAAESGQPQNCALVESECWNSIY